MNKVEDWKDILGRMKADPSLPEGEEMAVPEPQAFPPVAKDRLRVVIEKKGRKGKVATIVEGFTVSDEEVAEVAAMLKKKLGVGGSSRGGEILIQGDLADKVRALLRAEGYRL